MLSTLTIDDQLLAEARLLGGHATNEEAVAVALQEYVTRRKQLGILELFGPIEYDQDYDYKADRERDTEPR